MNRPLHKKQHRRHKPIPPPHFKIRHTNHRRSTLRLLNPKLPSRPPKKPRIPFPTRQLHHRPIPLRLRNAIPHPPLQPGPIPRPRQPHRLKLRPNAHRPIRSHPRLANSAIPLRHIRHIPQVPPDDLRLPRHKYLRFQPQFSLSPLSISSPPLIPMRNSLD
jgi:hypothetical protein